MIAALTPRQSVPAAGDRRTVYLHPGFVTAFAEPVSIVTILGSCVAVFLHDPMRGIGGANHFLLPRGFEPSARYADFAIPILVDRVIKLGASMETLVAKVFGGACTLRNLGTGHHLGRKNADAAAELLYRRGLPVVSCDVGGDKGRRVRFDLASGDVDVTYL